MLVLSRKPEESIVVGGGITITILQIKGNRVRVGIKAPNSVKVLRAELVEEKVAAAPCLTSEGEVRLCQSLGALI